MVPCMKEESASECWLSQHNDVDDVFKINFWKETVQLNPR